MKKSRPKLICKSPILHLRKGDWGTRKPKWWICDKPLRELFHLPRSKHIRALLYDRRPSAYAVKLVFEYDIYRWVSYSTRTRHKDKRWQMLYANAVFKIQESLFATAFPNTIKSAWLEIEIED